MRWAGRLSLVLIVTPAFLACASARQPVRFSEVPAPPRGEAFANWPHPPITTLEKMQEFDRTPIEVRSVKDAGGGVTGAEKVELFLPTRHEYLAVKAKKVPPLLDSWNNSPRKEIAAYRIQALFLDPVDYVVPTTTLRCMPLELWRKHHHSASPTVPGTSCVLVTLAFWLKDVALPDPLYDEERFLSEPRYADDLANFNILTYLVNHRDNRKGNFLVSRNESERRVFAIDNGVAFGAWIFNWFYPPNSAWRKIRVPALPRRTVERLRKHGREDLDQLAVIAQLEADDSGILRLVAPGKPFDPRTGARLRGTIVQFGLTDDEIEDVWGRIEKLIEDIDEGNLDLF